MAYLLRPATIADAPALTELLNVVDQFEIGRRETDLGTVEADLKHPETDLERDTWVAFDGDRAVAYGLVWDDSGGEFIDMDHYVLPDHQTAGRLVLDAMGVRALERARASGAAQAVAHLHLNAAPALDTSLIEARGWSVVRRYHVLRRDLDPARDLPPAPPAGVRIRPCATEADRESAHRLYQTSFAEHFDFHPRSYDQWLHDIDTETLDWSLVWLVSVEGVGDAGFLISRNDREAMGWIRSVGVLREARGQGVGGLLLRHAFAAFATLGRDTVGLGVDTENATGAPELYGRNGMTLHYAVDTWEAVLR